MFLRLKEKCFLPLNVFSSGLGRTCLSEEEDEVEEEEALIEAVEDLIEEEDFVVVEEEAEVAAEVAAEAVLTDSKTTVLLNM